MVTSLDVAMAEVVEKIVTIKVHITQTTHILFTCSQMNSFQIRWNTANVDFCTQS